MANNIPLHPLVVHIPLVFAGLVPLVITAVWWGRWRGRWGRGAWLLPLGAALVLAGSSFAAIRTGENEEEAIEEVVPRGALHDHEERAEGLFRVALLVLGAVTAAALVRRERLQHLAGGGALAASLAALVLAVLVGHSGGALVYRHNAASAYAAPSGGASSAGGNVERGNDRDGDHEARERR